MQVSQREANDYLALLSNDQFQDILNSYGQNTDTHPAKGIKNKAVREINYQNDKTISYSQFSIYAKCPFRWGLEYREGYRIYQPSMAAVFGTSVHVAMQHYIQVMFDTSGAEADRIDIESFFQQTFSDEYRKTLNDNKGIHFSSASEMRDYYEDGLAIIDYF